MEAARNGCPRPLQHVARARQNFAALLCHVSHTADLRACVCVCVFVCARLCGLQVVTAQQQLRERQRIERRLMQQLEAGAPGATDGAAELAAVSPRTLRRRLEDSETSRAEMAARLLNILRQENEGPDVP